jgi:hypothetical protein
VIHRDLHRENLWVTDAGPVLIDFGQAVRLRTRRMRIRDLGELDASVAPLLSTSDRIRLRAGLLGEARPFGASARRKLRAVGQASERRHRSHVESRTRRSLREGRLYARLSCAAGRGMRLRSQSEETARSALAGSNDVQRFRTALARPGSPARDAWLAGHGLRARGIGAPLPLAFIEKRRLLGVASAIWLEPQEPLEARNLERFVEELVALGVALRRHHIAIAADAALCRDAHGALSPTGLEKIRFRRRLSRAEVQRIDALLDTGLRNAGTAETERMAALRRYRARATCYDAETVSQRK